MKFVWLILDGQQPADLGVHMLREGFPLEWGEQRTALTGATPPAARPTA